jgi:transcriptional regulator with XRE-family HTH domain
MPNPSNQNLGKSQSKNMSENTNINFGKPFVMSKRPNVDVLAFKRRVRSRRDDLRLSQAALGKLCGYSQSNIAWIEDEKKDGPLDPRIQAEDLAEHLRTTPEWLLFGTGTRETAIPPMSPEELARNYGRLPLAEQEAITLQIQEFLTNRPRRKQREAAT